MVSYQRFGRLFRPPAVAVSVVWLAVVLPVLPGCSDDGTQPAAPVVASVQVTPSTGTLDVGQTLNLSAVVKSTTGDTMRSATVAWNSGNTAVATVSIGGLVTARGEGHTFITATSGGKSAQVDITVRVPEAALALMALSPTSIEAGRVGFTLIVSGSGFRPGAAVLWNGGERPTEFVGDAELHAEIAPTDISMTGPVRIRVVNPAPSHHASNELVFQVEVEPKPVARIELTPRLSMITIGQTVPLTVTLRDAAGAVLEGRFVHFSTSTDLVAIVGSSGVLTARAVGDAEITAWSGEVYQTMSVAVTERVQHLVMDGGGPALTVLNMARGGEPTPFWEHTTGTRVEDPSVSPDGRFIAYVIAQAGSRNVAVMDQATRTYQFLTSDNVSDQPAWSPAGDRIAFRSARYDRHDVWSIRPDGSARVNLTVGLPPGSQSENPAWSRDGNYIVFALGSGGDGRRLYTMNADGSNVVPLTLPGFTDTEPTWWGDMVVFTRRSADGTSDVWMTSVSTVGPTMPLTTSGKASMPAFSPDGRWIAYVDGEGTGTGDIWAMRPYGADPRPLSLRSEPSGGGLSPAWLAHN